ncbi:flagellar hook-length control protein FliK [Vibrio hannami]|uniref:flagellar hook-length control protein FliK n=1 Tax=Vibrio hannami TaxID=2717094 RepID=UPI00240F5524|nr:flagellar hook-length control protein FliK [Vibrio hannami]MDG3088772.1 flagellar hook-length control protein FliK [Vibrio hannami]
MSGESKEITEAEGDVESSAKMLDIESGVASSEGDSTEIEAENVEGEDASSKEVLSNKESETELKTASEKKVADSMSEGSALLDRLDESNQALKGNESGKELPQQVSSESLPKDKNETDHDRGSKVLNESAAAKAALSETDSSHSLKQPSEAEELASKYVRVENQGSEKLSKTDAESLKKVSENLQAVEGQKAKVVKGETPEAELKAAQLNHKISESVEEVKENPKVDGTVMAASTQIKPLTEKQIAAEGDKEAAANKEALIWETGKTASAVGVGAALGASTAAQAGVNSTSAVEIPSDAAVVQQILSKEPSELTEEELQILAQASSGATMSPETAKSAPEAVKSAALSSSAYALNQQHQAQQNQAMQQQAQLVNQNMDKAAAQQAAQSFSQNVNAIPLDVAQLSAQQAQVVSSPNKTVSNAAMMASVTAAGTASVMATKGKDKDKELSQQLSGLAGQQGLQQAQIRSEVQQAAAQSPLQLAREASGEQLAERVQMMMSKNLKNVDIRLDPPELGRMQIRMSMNGDMASVQFTVANSQARDMVEHAMPRLREMLSQQGIQLADSSVHQQSSGRQGQEYTTGNDGKGSGFSGGSSADDDLNLDESINLNANIASKDDGISYYA